jgi:hypothetical protein
VADEQLEAVRLARERFGDELIANPDVHGVGVGLRRRGGEKTGEYAVVVHVRRKLPDDEVPAGRMVPRELRVAGEDGSYVMVETDVQEHPVPVPEADPPGGISLGSRVRPVPGGMSASFSGTLGGWVWDTVTNQAVALSNRHVFGSVAGTRILQPSGEDGGSPGDRIGAVLRAGTLDASIAAPESPDMVSPSIIGGGPGVFGIVDATVGMAVQKTGRTTGVTHGVVDLIDYHSDHNGSRSDLWITGVGGDFSDAGDSGALYLETEPHDGFRRVAGLHWGGSDNDGVGHPIRAVFDDLRVTALSRTHA